ncbi:MAG: UDP-N-acetylglucosamine 1-carboxyvinyltransferase [Deltaproteobacteria bacterium]|nr:UDP-N-acetylglucosamine 1-carboxyvinyltransferase [Deltaproteobacteria bacterium]
MDAIVVKGGARLVGEVEICGAKNAALPLIASAILAPGRSIFKNVPLLRDVATMGQVLRHLGADVVGDRCLEVDTSSLAEVDAPYDLVRTMRASVLVLGPLLARFGRARVSLPGGCAIGARPIDQHLKGLEAMGATIELSEGYVEARCKKLHGAQITCDVQTVTGTMNLMMAAALARGRTTIENAACEPEVEDLACVINKMGGKVTGAGTSVVHIEGVDELQPVEHAIIPDRIEAGTFMVAAAITGGDVLIKNCLPEHLHAAIHKLEQAGAQVTPAAGGVRVVGATHFSPFEITTQPHPGFPTDMQAQFMVLATVADGQSTLIETIFENRFMHVPELCRMNAAIKVRGRTAVVRGRRALSGTTVMASDLRASAALILAGLIAEKGITRVRRVYHLDRGYERIEDKLSKLGATIERVKEA